MPKTVEQVAAERAEASAQAAKERADALSARLFGTLGAYQVACDTFKEKTNAAADAMSKGKGKAGVQPTPEWKQAEAAYKLALSNWREAADTKVELTSVPVDEIANVRAVAKEWLAANAALFGLFSLGGVIFGREVISELGENAQWIVPVAAIGAVTAGAAAILFGTKAAHGWPEKPGRGYKLFGRIYVPFLREPGYERKLKDPSRIWRCAVADLERAVWSAGLALLLLVIAVGTLWWDQAKADDPPVETVKLIAENDRTLGCGEFGGLQEDEFILLDEDGVEKEPRIPAADVEEILGAECSG